MSETTNATAEEKTVIDELNPWKVITLRFSDEKDFVWFLHEEFAGDWWDRTILNQDLLHAFVSRLAKAVLPPVETIYRLAWDHRVIVRPEGLSVDQAWAGLTNDQKFALDLWRAMMVAALQTARHHVALQEARTQTAVAMMRKPVPVEDTIFERHGSAFERDPVMVAALEGRGWQQDPLTVANHHDHDDHDDEAVPPPSPVSDEDLVTSAPEAAPAVEPDPCDPRAGSGARFEPDPAPKGARRKR